MYKNRWLKLLLLVPLCLLLGLIDAVRSYTSAYHDGVFYLSWENALRWDVSAWLVWVFFVPLVLWLSRRVRINQENWLWTAPMFGVIGLTLALFKTITPIIIYTAFVQPFNEILKWLSRTLFLLTDFLAAFVFYCFVLAFAQALNYYRQYREEELRASKLESQLTRAELQALKMQINPHFLFNTLHSISALQFEDADAAQTMTARLGDFLRLTLDNSSTQIVSLSREIDFLKCYLDIERVRFGKRLTTDFEIAPNALEAQVPNLILLPLVENAIKHGISKQAKAGLIRVGAKIANGELRLEVADNGAGLTQNGNGANGLPHHGLGLSNVRERLRQLYGANHSFELKAAPEGGLLVTISFPLTFADAVAHSLN
ncbi:MAG: sensor histidine kinase [Pyrinomonadaceae bacterium]